MRIVYSFVTGLALIAAAASAQGTTVTVGPLSCLPSEANGVATAMVQPEPPGTQVRLYFRRMNLEVEDFYWVEMHATGGGSYWGDFPKAEVSKFPKKELKHGNRDSKKANDWAEWWRSKENSDDRDPNADLNKDIIKEKASLGKHEKRAWMTKLDDDSMERWLELQTTEPAEYFVAVYDPSGHLVARSEMRTVDVKKDCKVTLTPQQDGVAANLTVGETSSWQKGKEVFHWMCKGIVTRVDPQLVLRADEACRACVVAWWPWVAGGSGAVAASTLLDKGTPNEVSPARP